MTSLELQVLFQRDRNTAENQVFYWNKNEFSIDTDLESADHPFAFEHTPTHFEIPVATFESDYIQQIESFCQKPASTLA